MKDHAFNLPEPTASAQRSEQEPFPAHVYRAPYARRPDLAPIDTAEPGDVLAMVSRYGAAFEERSDLERYLEGFYLAGDTAPAFAFYEDLSGAPRDRAARVAQDELFLGEDIHSDVLNWNMSECELCYQVNVVTFAEACVLFNIDLIRDPRHVRYFLADDPSFAPCVIEIFGDHDEITCLAKAARYLELVRSLLPQGDRPEPGFCALHFCE